MSTFTFTPSYIADLPRYKYSLSLSSSTLIISGTFSTDAWPLVLNLIGSVAILAGIYYLLYKISREKLVGGGDWILALAIAIMLGSWWLALIALFLSNFLASIYGIAQKIKIFAHIGF